MKPTREVVRAEIVDDPALRADLLMALDASDQRETVVTMATPEAGYTHDVYTALATLAGTLPGDGKRIVSATYGGSMLITREKTADELLETIVDKLFYDRLRGYREQADKKVEPPQYGMD